MTNKIKDKPMGDNMRLLKMLLLENDLKELAIQQRKFRKEMDKTQSRFHKGMNKLVAELDKVKEGAA